MKCASCELRKKASEMLSPSAGVSVHTASQEEAGMETNPDGGRTAGLCGVSRAVTRVNTQVV